jgi:hypothetical protein
VVLDQSDLLTAARRAWERTLESLSEAVAPPGLHTGFCGPAWVAAHLGDRLDQEEDDSQHEDIEATLLAHLVGRPRYANYDLIGGLVGFGIYALERWPRGRSPEILDVVVERIVAQAEPGDRGSTWTTPPELLPLHQRRVAPNGYHNLGVAHGVPGLLAFLARAVRTSPAPKAERALEDGVRWLLDAQLPLTTGLRYASWIPIGKAGTPQGDPDKPLGWCYGDLGVAAALLVAGRSAGREDWSQEGVAIARRCADVGLPATGVREHGLCHGSAGIGLLFARLANATDDPLLAAASRQWFERTLESRDPDVGDEGYFAMLPRDVHDVETGGELDLMRVNTPGFLVGAAGVALALAAAFSDIEPEWDRVLLASA